MQHKSKKRWRIVERVEAFLKWVARFISWHWTKAVIISVIVAVINLFCANLFDPSISITVQFVGFVFIVGITLVVLFVAQRLDRSLPTR